jgi:hypothetical protein
MYMNDGSLTGTSGVVLSTIAYERSYEGMFANCTSLTATPQILC